MKQNVKVETKEREQPQPAAAVCGHFWVIDVANGPTSMGQCKYCGDRKEFYNAFQDFNPLRRHGNPMKLPVLPDVKVEKGRKS